MNPSTSSEREPGRPTAATLVVILLLLAALFVAHPLPTARATNGVDKDMTFLLHSVNASETAKPLPGGGSALTYFDTSLEFNDVNVSILVEGTVKVLAWFLSPALAGDFRSDRVTLRIWANSSTAASSSAQVTLEVFEQNATDSVLVNQLNLGSQSFTVTPELKTWPSPFAAPYTFRVGSSVELRLTVTPGALQGVWFHYDTAQFNSRVSLGGPDSLDIAGIATLDSNRVPTTNFDPTASNQTMYIQAQMTDPLGGYDIKWVNMSIYDPFGALLVDNVSMVRISGTPVDFESVYEQSFNYSGQPTGSYTVGIWAVDNNGHNSYFFFSQFTYADFDVYREGTFSIGQVFFVNLLVLDDASVSLANARVLATQIGMTIAAGLTNASGMVNLTLGSGLYDFVVVWQAVSAGSLNAAVTDNVTESDPLVIQAAVYYPTFRVVDSHASPLADAALTYTHPNGTTIATPLLTDESGEVALAQMAGGDYAISVRWRGTEVASLVVDVAASAVYVINAAVYYVDFRVVDSQGVSIEFASIVVRDTTSGLVLDFQATDGLGEATSRLPVGLANIEVFLRDIQVAEVTGFLVDSDQFLQIDASVYYVTLTVVDSRSVALDGAIVSLQTGSTVFQGTTGANGATTIRVPTGTYSVSVSWRGVGVHASTGFAVSADGSATLPTSVYYVTFTAQDSQGELVEDAQITVRNVQGDVVNSGATDAAGSVELRLPAATYSVSATWKGHPVYAASHSVSGDGTIALPVGVYYHTLTLVDSRGAPVEDASVSVTDDVGVVLDAEFTSAQGTVSLRLPAGTFDVSGSWLGVPVLSAPLTVSGDGASSLEADVFYLTVTVVNRAGLSIAGVIVAVEPDSPGLGRAMEFTQANGEAEFRLPAGPYHVVARLITTFQLTPIDIQVEDDIALVDDDVSLQLQMAEFEPPFYGTYAFGFSLALILVIAGFIAYIYWRYHRPKKPKSTVEPESPMEPQQP